MTFWDKLAASEAELQDQNLAGHCIVCKRHRPGVLLGVCAACAPKPKGRP